MTAFAVPDRPRPGTPLYALRRDAQRRRLEDDEQRARPSSPSSTPSPSSRSATSRWPRPTPNVVWVGTGEPYCARLLDLGRRRLEVDGCRQDLDEHGASRIRTTSPASSSIPKNPDVVYVAAMGHLFGPNAERGVFKTTDGGRTWAKVLYVDDKIGAVDLALVESGPDTLYAAMYDKIRLPWHYEPGRAGERDLQDDRRRGQDLDPARGRPADGPDRPHRARRLPTDPRRSTPWSRTPIRGEPTAQEKEQDAPAGRSRPAAHGRQRGLPQRRRRRRLAQGQRRLRGRAQQGALFLQPAAHRSRPTPTRSTSPASRWPRRTTAARPGRGWAGPPTASCPRPSATGAACGSTRSTRPADLRLGRRRQRQLRPRQDPRPRSTTCR